MQVLRPRHSHCSGGDNASNQKSRGKGRQLATPALKYVKLPNDIGIVQKKNSNYFYTKHTEIKQTEKQKSRELENLFVLLKKKRKRTKESPVENTSRESRSKNSRTSRKSARRQSPLPLVTRDAILKSGGIRSQACPISRGGKIPLFAGVHLHQVALSSRPFACRAFAYSTWICRKSKARRARESSPRAPNRVPCPRVNSEIAVVRVPRCNRVQSRCPETKGLLALAPRKPEKRIWSVGRGVRGGRVSMASDYWLSWQYRPVPSWQYGRNSTDWVECWLSLSFHRG